MDQNNIYAQYASALQGDAPQHNQFAGGIAQGQAKVAEAQDANAAAANDPGKAQMKLLPNNQGYAFYDGAGKRISINDFSLITGKRPDELLGDSPNPVDQKFVQDYKTLTAFTNAWVNGDKGTLAKMREADPQSFNKLISSYKSPGEVIGAFTKHWSNYYSPGGGQQTSATPSFAPQALNQPDKKTSQALEGLPISSVLTPASTATPPPKPNFLEKLAPWSGTRQKYSAYQSYLKNNPWAAYQSALTGE